MKRKGNEAKRKREQGEEGRGRKRRHGPTLVIAALLASAPGSCVLGSISCIIK